MVQGKHHPNHLSLYKNVAAVCIFITKWGSEQFSPPVEILMLSFYTCLYKEMLLKRAADLVEALYGTPHNNQVRMSPFLKTSFQNCIKMFSKLKGSCCCYCHSGYYSEESCRYSRSSVQRPQKSQPNSCFV